MGFVDSVHTFVLLFIFRAGTCILDVMLERERSAEFETLQ